MTQFLAQSNFPIDVDSASDFHTISAWTGSALLAGLSLPPAPPAIIAVADSLIRVQVVIDSACSWQRGCAVAIAEVRNCGTQAFNMHCSQLAVVGVFCSLL